MQYENHTKVRSDMKLFNKGNLIIFIDRLFLYHNSTTESVQKSEQKFAQI